MNVKYLVGLPLLFCAGAVHAQYLGPISAPCVVGSNLSCTPVTAANPLPTTSASGSTAANQTATGANAQTVQGNVASGATDAGNPDEIGGYASSATPTAVPAGSRVRAWFGLSGQFVTVPQVFSASGGYAAGQIGIPVDSDGGVRPTVSAMLAFNSGTNNYQAPIVDSNGLWTVAKGGSNLATGQVSVGTTATLIAAARAGRQRIQVIVGAANACALGTAAVTLTTGYALPAVAGTSDTSDTAAALYAVCSAATTISYKELY